MTVSYTSEVICAKKFGCFVKLLFRWRGSIYKLIWPDLIVFLATFMFLGTLYHYILSESHQRVFEKISIYCEKYGSLIPIAFVLGFYISQVISRWWDQYKNIPWIDNLSMWIHASIRGDEEKDRILRRTILRYACLSITQCFVLISPRVKRRFPTLDHLVEAGLLLESEKEIMVQLENTSNTGAQYKTNFIPLVWAGGLVVRGRAENKIKNDGFVNVTLAEINKIRDQCFMLQSYDWISLPLVYTQVVTLAVYMYFLAALMGKQWLIPRDVKPQEDGEEPLGVESILIFFPVFTVLQFFFYMGWLKVAESLLNPFGDDDDDFELNWIVDRNIQVAYLIVDEMHCKPPELLRDQYWEDVVPPELPHTVASELTKDKEGPPESSTAKVIISRKEGEIIASSVRSNLHLTTAAIDGASGEGSPSSLRKRQRSIIAKQETIGGIGAPGSVGSSSKLSRIGSAFKRMVTGDKSGEMDTDEELGTLMGVTTTTTTAGAGGGDTIPELDENAGSFDADAPDLNIPTDAAAQAGPSPGEERERDPGELDPLRDVKTICI